MSRLKLSLGLLLAISLGQAAMAAGPLDKGVAYQGSILDANSVPLAVGTAVPFTIKIMAPDGTCALFSETLTATIGAAGSFSLMVGADATGAASALFDNSISHACASGSTYTPSPSDLRYLRASFTLNGTTSTLADAPIVASPMSQYAAVATNAQSLGGVGAGSFLQANQSKAISQSSFEDLFAKVSAFFTSNPNASSQLSAVASGAVVAGNPASVGSLNSADNGKVLTWSSGSWVAATPAPAGIQSLTGNVAIDSSGNTAIQPGAVSTSMLADNAVTNAKISSIDASKVSGTLSTSAIPGLSTDWLTAGTLPVSRGGTGTKSFAINQLVASDALTGSTLTSFACAPAQVLSFDALGGLKCADAQSGPQGIQGPKGDTGANGTNGVDGATGPKGDPGAQGIQGIKGDKGDTGAAGTAGTNGTNGTNGVDGAVGATGATGANGLSLSVGSVTPAGTAGQDGDSFINSATGDLYNKISGAWSVVANLVGPKGDKGDTGAAGTNGTNGTNGVDGAVGATGPKGDKGDTGAAGTNGTNGAPGANGLSVSSGTGLPMIPGQNGDSYVDVSSGSVYQYSGSAWATTAIGSLKGPAGTNGTSGTPGTNASITAQAPLIFPNGGTSGTLSLPQASAGTSGYLSGVDYARLAPMPSSANELSMVRVNSTGTAYESRTVAQVLADLGLNNLSTQYDAYGAASAALQKSANLSDLPSPSAARTSLGLGGAATLNAGGISGLAQLDGIGLIPTSLLPTVAGLSTDTFGDASHVAQVSFDSYGRASSLARIAIGGLDASTIATGTLAQSQGGTGSGDGSINGAGIIADGSNNLFVGFDGGTTSGAWNTSVGAAGYLSGLYNTAVGGASGNGGSYNTSVGAQSMGAQSTGANNSVLGYMALVANVAGSDNAAVGSQALFRSSTSRNTAVGSQALIYSTSGAGNTAIGYGAGYDVTTGASNLFLGSFPTTGVGVTTGSNNVMIGYDVRPQSRTASNQLNIGNLIYATGIGSGATVSSGSVGIGTTAPSSALDVNGAMTLRAMAAPPVASGSQGRIYFDSTSQSFLTSASGGSFAKILTAGSTLSASLISGGTLGTANGSALTSLNAASLTGTLSLSTTGTASFATSAANITATTNATLTGLSALTSAPLLSLSASQVNGGTLNASSLVGALPMISGASLTSLNASQLLSGSVPYAAIPAFSSSGDVTQSGGTLTLSTTVNSSPGSYGGALAIPTITVNNKGLVTSVSSSSLNLTEFKATTVSAVTTGSHSSNFSASGSGTYTVPSGASYIRVRMVGGGGGGAGSGSSAGSAAVSGGTTSFGPSLLVAGGGAAAPSISATANGGAGGTASIGSGASGISFSGQPGGSGIYASLGNDDNFPGGSGGATPFGGAGSGQFSAAAGPSAAANTGSGGGGGGDNIVSYATSGGGGGAGGFVDAIVSVTPGQTFAYQVGGGGAGGGAGGSGFVGGSGAGGQIVIEEVYGYALASNVGSSAVGALRTEGATITNNGTSCAITTQLGGNWISTAVRQTTAGQCVLNFTALQFSQPPVCTCSVIGNSGGICTIDSAPTASSVYVDTTTGPGNWVNLPFAIQCVGQH